MLRLVSLGATARRFQSTAIASYRHCSSVSGGPQLLGALESQIKAKELNVMKEVVILFDLNKQHKHTILIIYSQQTCIFILLPILTNLSLLVHTEIPFTIQDDDKHCHVMLTRELGREKIEVTVNPVYETNDDEESEECVRINVSISKEKKGKLGLGADVCGDEILVDKISYFETNSYISSMRLEGVETEGELQDALNGFMKARGIEISTVGFLYKYMVSKGKRWGKTPKRSVDDLKKFHKFVENW